MHGLRPALLSVAPPAGSWTNQVKGRPCGRESSFGSHAPAWKVFPFSTVPPIQESCCQHGSRHRPEEGSRLGQLSNESSKRLYLAEVQGHACMKPSAWARLMPATADRQVTSKTPGIQGQSLVESHPRQPVTNLTSHHPLDSLVVSFSVEIGGVTLTFMSILPGVRVRGAWCVRPTTKVVWEVSLYDPHMTSMCVDGRVPA